MCTNPTAAEMEGFEPPVPSRVHRISSAARSTTLAHLRGKDTFSRGLVNERCSKLSWNFRVGNVPAGNVPETSE